MIEKSENESTTLQRLRDIVILFAIGVLFLVGQSAYWLNHVIFDKATFTSTVTPILQSESSRQSVASTITDKAFADKPIVNRLIGTNVTALISGLLATDVAQQMISGLVNRTYVYLTTDNPQPIAIDLVAIKTPLQKITDILESRGRDVSINPDNIPDQIVLFDPSNLPNIYSYSVTALWAGPIAWIGFLVLAALYIYMGRRIYARRVYILGGVIIIAALIGLSVGPLISPPLIAQVPIPDLRPIVSQILAALLSPFASQLITAIVITAIVLIIFFSRFAIVRGAQWTVKKAGDMTSGSQKPPKSESKKK
jgi:hypothetical protein